MIILWILVVCILSNNILFYLWKLSYTCLPTFVCRSDLAGCGCLFRAFAVLRRRRISLLGSRKMDLKGIQLLRPVVVICFINKRIVWKCFDKNGCQHMLAQRRYIVCVCMRPRNAASIWIGDSFKRLCSWWWTNYFGRCELWQNWHLKTRKWRGRILFGFLRRDSIVLYGFGFISCSWVTLTNHTTSCSWYPQAAGLIWRGNKKRLMASKIIAQTHRSFQRQRLPYCSLLLGAWKLSEFTIEE